MKEFIEWLSKIGVSYESLSQEQKISAKQGYDESRPPGLIIGGLHGLNQLKKNKNEKDIRNFVRFN
jgi:hypothetical protein